MGSDTKDSSQQTFRKMATLLVVEVINKNVHHPGPGTVREIESREPFSTLEGSPQPPRLCLSGNRARQTLDFVIDDGRGLGWATATKRRLRLRELRTIL